MSIMDELNRLTNFTVTQNGDVAFKTTLDANLDLFSKMGSIRSSRFYQCKDKMLNDLRVDFQRAYYENKELSLANLIYLRDILTGLGERDSFRHLLETVVLPLHENKMQEFLDIIEKYGRWDDSLIFLDNDETAPAYANFIRQRLENEPPEAPSLLAKWLPSINTSSSTQVARAKKLAKLMGYSERHYRKTLSALRKQLNIVETNLSKRDYSKINYQHVPARAMNKYKNAFSRADNENYSNYLHELLAGTVQAKSKTLYPHEIIRALTSPNGDTSNEEAIILAEAQWKAIERPSSDVKTIVVRDGSASMIGLPMQIGDALTILFSESLTGEFKDKFITFSSRPQFVDLTGAKTLDDKLSILSKYQDVTNTNIEAVYELILQASLNLPEEELIDRIVIISDMEFDQATVEYSYTRYGYHEEVHDMDSTLELARAKFLESGIKFPEIVFWNVNSNNSSFPASKFDNVKLVSGYSSTIIKDIINNESISPLEHMLKVLSRYDADVQSILN